MEINNNSRTRVTYISIGEDRAGQRIDNFLFCQLKGVPKKHIYRILRRGEVRVNSKRIRPFYRLISGDSIRVPPVQTATIKPAVLADNFKPGDLENRILYEDKFIIAINKPAGMPVHGGTGQRCGLIEALRLLRTNTAYLELVHRLDLETSGCLLIAKRRSVLRTLHEQFRSNTIRKRYQALLAGCWQKQKQRVDAPIRKQRLADGSRKVYVSSDGKQATTEIRCIQRWNHYTHVECQPLTGRTHQIRVHSQFIGHPIIGDQRYGLSNANKLARAGGLNRQFLHATSLCFKHPENGEIISLDSSLDADLTTFLSTLDGKGRN
ncbi:MAG TPA: RluA family pseudouridine synthase [Crenotrichaceae bacterium]|nr:RluA family pseudouridine synthase [Crenotrichaceae bacterium]